MGLVRLCLKFLNQQEADDAVIALSKHYQVTQFSTNCSKDGYNHFVNVLVPAEDVYPEGDND